MQANNKVRGDLWPEGGTLRREVMDCLNNFWICSTGSGLESPSLFFFFLLSVHSMDVIWATNGDKLEENML